MLGRMWRTRMRGSVVPAAIAASTYGCSRKLSTRLRTRRTTRGTSASVMATITLPMLALVSAISAMASMTMSMTPPTSAVGWRLNASRKRRHVGDTDLVATGAARAVVLISITYPRIEQHVRKIDRQIDQHVDRGKNQDHALDDGIVAAQDGVDGEAADAGQREHCLGDNGAADQQCDAHADDRHHGNRGVLERMADQHLLRRKPFRLG